MLSKEELTKIVRLQRDELRKKDTGIAREKAIKLASNHAIIVKGVRRCGKSTLLAQAIAEIKNCAYFNFDDPRTAGIELKDFERLAEIFEEDGAKVYCFDEIQLLEGWERYIRLFLDQGKRCIVTGSNAKLLSRELGTHLTGRHLDIDLFPFSYSEYLTLQKKKQSQESFLSYLDDGGFPQFLRDKNIEILQTLFSDILSRDIIARFGIKESAALSKIAVYLMTNAGKEFSYNKLRALSSLSSVNTVASYISYLEDSYLLFSLPRFSRSLKKQLINPKKAYPIDLGLARANSVSFSEDIGKKLESAVYLHLKRKNKEIYYFKETGECDFLVAQGFTVTKAVQVCTNLTSENLHREIAGLKEAMITCKMKEGFIVTLGKRDMIDNISIVPAWDWMLE